MKPLAIDAAGRFGFAVGPPTAPPESGSILIPPGDLGVRFAWFYNRLNLLIDEHQPDRIIFETPILFRAQDRIHNLRWLYTLAGIVEMVAAQRDLPCFEEEARTVRKHFLGKVPKGSATIKQAVVRMCALRGWRVCDHNAADACATWDYLIASQRTLLTVAPLRKAERSPTIRANPMRFARRAR